MAVAVALVACGGDPNMRADGSDGTGGSTVETGLPDARRPDVIERDAPDGPDATIDEPDVVAPDVSIDEPDAAALDSADETPVDAVDEPPADAADEDAPAPADSSIDAEPEASVEASVEAGPDEPAPDAADCMTGLTPCTGADGARACIDVRSDPMHCGACGVSCASGTACVAGSCACPMGQTRCGDACVNAMTDGENCGACGVACSGGAACVAGACACTMGQARCGERCVNTSSDTANCGACGSACPAGSVCSSGACQRECTAPQTRCGAGASAACADLASDEANCGACGNACAPEQSCTASVCVCPAGRTACGVGAAAACVDTQSDLANCGACGAACTGGPNASTAFCISGACRPVCNAGRANCDGASANGCETNLATDDNNCGACAQQCAVGSSCVAGACQANCTGGSNMLCGGVCVDTASSVLHCGMCGRACPANATCSSGACVCGGGLLLCSNSCINRLTDVNNCGSCANVCPSRANATPRCSAGSCGLSCMAGFADCDGNTATGCETDTTANNNNCGACGNACAAAQTCSSGACVSRASSITVSGGGSQSAQVGAAFATPLSAVVRDALGMPVPGAVVTFTAPAATGSNATGTFGGAIATTATTNAAGVATAPTLTAGARTGAWQVNATVGAVGPAAFSLTNTAGAPATVTAIAPSARSSVVGQDFTAFSVRVDDANGNPVPGVGLTFEAATVSSASATFPSGATATTDATGVATRTARANGVAGGPYALVARVTAQPAVVTSPGFALTNTAGAPASVLVVSGNNQSAATGAAFASPLRVRVVDSFGNAVGGATVSFTSPASGASASLAPATAVTSTAAGTLGEASTSATANGTAGMGYAVTASVAPGTGSLGATFSLTNVDASVTTLAPEARTTPQQIAVGSPPPVALGVIARNGSGVPVVGVAVTFSVPPGTGVPGGYFGTPGTNSFVTTTDASGVARAANFVANSTAGGYLVTAAAGSLSSSFSLENVARVPAVFTASNGTVTYLCPSAGDLGALNGHGDFSDGSPAIAASVRLEVVVRSGDVTVAWARNGMQTLHVALNSSGNFLEALSIMPPLGDSVIELRATPIGNPSLARGPFVVTIGGAGCEFMPPGG